MGAMVQRIRTKTERSKFSGCGCEGSARSVKASSWAYVEMKTCASLPVEGLPCSTSGPEHSVFTFYGQHWTESYRSKCNRESSVLCLIQRFLPWKAYENLSVRNANTVGRGWSCWEGETRSSLSLKKQLEFSFRKWEEPAIIKDRLTSQEPS